MVTLKRNVNVLNVTEYIFTKKKWLKCKFLSFVCFATVKENGIGDTAQ
jgi:hypothetical protein